MEVEFEVKIPIVYGAPVPTASEAQTLVSEVVADIEVATADETGFAATLEQVMLEVAETIEAQTGEVVDTSSIAVTVPPVEIDEAALEIDVVESDEEVIDEDDDEEPIEENDDEDEETIESSAPVYGAASIATAAAAAAAFVVF